LRREEIDDAANSVPEAADGSFGGFSQMRFEFRKGFFDWIEVGAVGRQIKQAGACRANHRTDGGPLVAGQIVHHNDVARLEFGDENLFDIDLKSVPVDRTIEHKGRRNPADPNPGDEGRCLPVSMRDAGTQPLPARAAPMCASHVRRGPGLVDENETLGIKVELALEPVLSPLQDVGTILLAGVRSLFLRVSLWRLQKRQSAATLNCAPDCASRVFNSGRVMSGVSTRRARIRSP